MKPVRLPSGRWQVGVRTGIGRGAPRRFRTFDTKTEALRWQTEMRAQIQRGAWSAPRDDLTFRQWADEWLLGLDVSAGTRDSYGYHLKRLSGLDAYRVGQLRRPLLERHLEDLSGSASYRAQTQLVLAIILKAAVRDGLLTANPLQGVKTPKVARREVQTFTAEQIRRLLLAVDPRYRTMLVVGVGSGLRQAELLGLRASRIDLARRTLAVEEQVTTGTRRPAALTGVLKTPSARRRLPLPAYVIDTVASHLAEHPGIDLLFTTPRTGSPWRRGALNEQVWKPALEAAGLDVTLGMHTLRHTYASHLIHEGQHPRVIQARLGHASIVETMDTYGHLFPEQEDMTRSALDGLFLGAGSSVGTVAGEPHPL